MSFKAHNPDWNRGNLRHLLRPMLLFPLFLFTQHCEKRAQPASQTEKHTPSPNPTVQISAKSPLVRASAVPLFKPPIRYGSLADAMEIIHEKPIKESVYYLASPELQGRKTGSDGFEKAAKFIEQELTKNKVQSWGKRFRHSWSKSETAYNLAAFYPKSDPEDPEETIILGAHLDHLGVSSSHQLKDKVFHGADDNASGASALLMIAKALTRTHVKVHRNILFLWFSGEEIGLVGSTGYCSHPLIPLSQSKAMINMDMIGRNPTLPVVAYGAGHSTPFRSLILKAKKDVTGLNIIGANALGPMENSSDQQPFFSKGIPVMAIHTHAHADYHRTSDVAEKISYPHLKKVTQFVLSLIVRMANHKEGFPFIKHPAYRP
jgi:hypothetical protein